MQVLNQTPVFLTIQDGDYSINVNMICGIDWTAGKDEATVKTCDGEEYTVEGDDHLALCRIVFSENY